MAKPTISMPDELLERIDSQIRGTDSRSGWLREAAEEKLARETESSGSRPEEGAA